MFLDYIITKSWITECSCLITTIITSNPISRLSCMPESTIKRELYKAFDITFGFGTITVALSFTFETQLTTVATFLNGSIYTRSIIWGVDSWQRTKNTLITCYFEWYWNSSRLIVRFIFLLIKTENTDAFSEKKKKKCCIIKKDLSVVHEKFASINQKHYQDLGSVASSKWNFSAPFPSQTSFRGENIDCFLRIFHKRRLFC